MYLCPVGANKLWCSFLVFSLKIPPLFSTDKSLGCGKFVGLPVLLRRPETFGRSGVPPLLIVIVVHVSITMDSASSFVPGPKRELLG